MAICEQFSSRVVFTVFVGADKKQRASSSEEFCFNCCFLFIIFFTHNGILLTSSSEELQHALEQFEGKCEEVGMKINNSNLEAMSVGRLLPSGIQARDLSSC